MNIYAINIHNTGLADLFNQTVQFIGISKLQLRNTGRFLPPYDKHMNILGARKLLRNSHLHNNPPYSSYCIQRKVVVAIHHTPR